MVANLYDIENRAHRSTTSNADPYHVVLPLHQRHRPGHG